MNIYKEAWMKVYEVKKDRMTKIENDVKMGTNHYVHGNKGNRSRWPENSTLNVLVAGFL